MISIQVQVPEVCSYYIYHISQGKQNREVKVQLVLKKNHCKLCALYCCRYYLNLNEATAVHFNLLSNGLSTRAIKSFRKKWVDMAGLKVASVCLCKYSSFPLFIHLYLPYILPQLLSLSSL